MTASSFRTELIPFQGWFPDLLLKELDTLADKLSAEQMAEVLRVLNDGRAEQAAILEKTIEQVKRPLMQLTKDVHASIEQAEHNAASLPAL